MSSPSPGKRRMDTDVVKLRRAPIGQAVTIRNKAQGGASHTADLNNKRAVGGHMK